MRAASIIEAFRKLLGETDDLTDPAERSGIATR